MKTNQVFTAFVKWPSGGKRQPVLIRKISKSEIIVYKITTKFQNKASRIKQYYYKIRDLDEAGLYQQSYIDTITLVGLPRSVYFKQIGELSVRDIKGLTKFIQRKNN